MAKKSIKVSKKKAPKKEPDEAPEIEFREYKNRKKGTHYDRNRIAVRTYQQQRRADIKAGKIIPGKKSTPVKPRVKKAAVKKKTPVKKARMYKSEAERTPYKVDWAKKNRQKKVQEFRDFFKANYPTEDE